MKTYHTLPLLCLLTMPALAAQQVDTSLKLDGPLSLEISVQRGQVELSTWDSPSIQVQGTLDEASEGLIFENQNGRVVLEDKLPKNYQGSNAKGSALIIKVPATLSLRAEGVSTDFTLDALKGELGVSTVSGAIKATTLDGSISLSSVSGDIHTRSLRGTAVLETVSGSLKDTESANNEGRYKAVSGDINLQNQVNNVRIEQVSGDTVAQLPSADTVQYSGVSGDANLTVKGDVKLSGESVSGDIALMVKGPADLKVSINGGPSGDIDNGLSKDKPVSPRNGPGSKLDMRLGQGKGSLDITTISGDISLK